MAAGVQYSTAELQAYAAQLASQYGIDPQIFAAQITQESGWDPSAVSKTGCQGIAQICDSVSFDTSDPIASLQYMANRDAQALSQFGGNWPLALVAYNCGPGCAQQYAIGARTLPAETQDYITKILGGNAWTSQTTGGPSVTGSLLPATGANSGSTFKPAPLGAQSLIVWFAAIVILFAIFGSMKRK